MSRVGLPPSALPTRLESPPFAMESGGSGHDFDPAQPLDFGGGAAGAGGGGGDEGAAAPSPSARSASTASGLLKPSARARSIGSSFPGAVDSESASPASAGDPALQAPRRAARAAAAARWRARRCRAIWAAVIALLLFIGLSAFFLFPRIPRVDIVVANAAVDQLDMSGPAPIFAFSTNISVTIDNAAG
jgi:hypothetical protein